jgi:hypothetical protein
MARFGPPAGAIPAKYRPKNAANQDVIREAAMACSLRVEVQRAHCIPANRDANSFRLSVDGEEANLEAR